MFAKANYQNGEIKNLYYDHELFMYPFENQEIPSYVGIVPIVEETEKYPDIETLDYNYDLYKVKMISVFKGIIDSDSIPTKERFADIDMKSIKYFYSKNDIVCNLYAQNIQDENIITKLDDFFDNNNYSLVEFIIIPDSFKFMEELGYKCYSKRYIVDYE